MTEQIPRSDWPDVWMAVYWTIGINLFACFVGSLRAIQYLSLGGVSIAVTAAIVLGIVGCVPVALATVTFPKDYRRVVAILAAIGWSFFSGYWLGQWLLLAAE